MVDDRNRVRTVYVDRERQQQVKYEVKEVITDITSTYIKIDTKDEEQKYYYASIFTVYIDGVEEDYHSHVQLILPWDFFCVCILLLNINIYWIRRINMH